jgi:ADP-ribose pyrophosphatase
MAGFYVSPGYVTEFIHVFLARGLLPDPGQADADEDIVVQRVPLEEALTMVEAGEIRDAKSIIGLLLAAKRLAH